MAIAALHTLVPKASLRIVVPRGASRFLLYVLGGAVRGKHHLQLELGAEATCECVVIHRADHSASLLQESTIHAGARLHLWQGAFGKGDWTHETHTTLKGNNAECAVHAVAHAKGKTLHKLLVGNTFLGAEGRGDITMKAIAEDRASINCQGLIVIGPKGNGTNTYLTQNVLMLDTTAKVDAKPALEIKTNDVKASHSATIARVTEEDLFYFASRGIDQKEARKMFVEGFLGDLLEKVEHPEARKNVENIIHKTLRE